MPRNFNSGMDPDRYQMRDLKRRMSSLEKSYVRLEKRFERRGTIIVDLRSQLRVMEEGLGMLFGAAWGEAISPKGGSKKK